MVDEGREDASSRPWEDRGGRAVGTVLATAIAAGVIAYIVRRSRAEEEIEPATQLARLRDWANSDSLEAGREFVMDKIVPELKPALLSALSEIEDIVDQAFRRAEKSIKKL
jgi:hypothetical protein